MIITTVKEPMLSVPTVDNPIFIYEYNFLGIISSFTILSQSEHMSCLNPSSVIVGSFPNRVSSNSI